LDAELLIAHVLNKPREFVIAHPEQKINKSIKQKINRLIKQRAKGVPLAYLTEHKEFYGLDFFVNENVLIPRPETELIVDLVLKRLETCNVKHGTYLIDVGTGGGCIPIAIEYKIRKSGLSVIRKLFAIDISQPALKVAKKNAKKHKVKIKFLRGDLLQPFIKQLQHFQQLKQLQHLIITANLPYLTPQQYKSEPSIQHEPRLALVAKKQGLDLYEKLLKQIRQLVTSYKLQVTIFFEINPQQTKSIKNLINKSLPHAKIKIHKDLAKKNRVVEIKILLK